MPYDRAGKKGKPLQGGQVIKLALDNGSLLCVDTPLRLANTTTEDGKENTLSLNLIHCK